MTTITISFDDASKEDRIPMRIRRLQPLEESTEDWVTDVRAPGEGPTTVNVEPGQYLVEALWRNGRVTTKRCIVGKHPTAVVLSRGSRQMTSRSAVRDFSQPSAGGMFRPTGASDSPYFLKVIPTSGNWTTWALLVDSHEIEKQSGVSTESLPAPRSGDMQVHGLRGADRSWVVYWACDHWAMSSLPSTSDGKCEPTALLRSDPIDLPFLSVVDPDIGTMTDLLPAGNAEAAHRYASLTIKEFGDVFRDCTERRHPLEFCAFAYAEREHASNRAWAPEHRSLLESFVDIPDAFVLLGWETLLNDRDDQAWNRAGSYFSRAIDTGVPFYSMGVRLLAEGLTMISASIESYGPAAAIARSASARVVPSEAFTTVRF